jgi:hypothetical protein
VFQGPAAALVPWLTGIASGPAFVEAPEAPEWGADGEDMPGQLPAHGGMSTRASTRHGLGTAHSRGPGSMRSIASARSMGSQRSLVSVGSRRSMGRPTDDASQAPARDEGPRQPSAANAAKLVCTFAALSAVQPTAGERVTLGASAAAVATFLLGLAARASGALAFGPWLLWAVAAAIPTAPPSGASKTPEATGAHTPGKSPDAAAPLALTGAVAALLPPPGRVLS